MSEAEEMVAKAAALLDEASNYRGLNDESWRKHWEAIGGAKWCIEQARKILSRKAA